MGCFHYIDGSGAAGRGQVMVGLSQLRVSVRTAASARVWVGVRRGGEVDAAAVGGQRPGAPPLSMSDTLAQIGGSKSKTVSMSSRSVSAIGSPPPTYPYSGRARGFPSMSVQVYWQHRDQTSGVLRRSLSRGTSDLNISPAHLAAIEGRLNAIPGELHDWHSAHSVYTALCRNHRWSLA